MIGVHFMNKRFKFILLLFLFVFYISLSCSYYKKSETLAITIYPTDYGLDIQATLPSNEIRTNITSDNDCTNNYYLFLPSYALGKQFTFTHPDSITIKPESESCTYVLSYSQSFKLSDQSSLHILVGSNIPTIYLTLEHDLSYICSDKSCVDTGQATIINDDGSISYSGKLKKIKGRGNTSWTSPSPKKPYNITFEDSVSLFGMRTSDSFSLITSSDYSFIRNKISNSMAEVLNISSMKRQHISLYINGEYQGLYELCERISANTLNIPDLESLTQESIKQSLSPLTQITTGETFPDWNNTITGKWWSWDNNQLPDSIGGYIIEVDHPIRYDAEPSGFILNSGAYMTAIEPSYLSEEQYNYITDYMQNCEDLIYQALETESLEELSKYINVSSFVGKYLVEEVSKNIDFSSTSQFFFIDESGKLNAGPVWDFDKAYGTDKISNGIDFNDPNGFSTSKTVRGSFDWWQVLYYTKGIHNDIVDKYNNTLYPFLTHLTNYKVIEWENEIIDSATMDYIKWNHASSTEEARQKYHQEIIYVSDFLKQRMEFLYNEWNS